MELFSKFGLQEKVQITESNGMKKVFVKGQPYMSWKMDDQVAPRVAITQLYESGLATQEELAKIFGIHIKSVYNYVMNYSSGRMQDLIGQRSGPKQRWKVTPQIRAKILFLALKGEATEYAEIKKRLELWNTKVSIESIRQVLTENGLVKEQINIPKMEQSIFSVEDGNRQLEMHLFDYNENITLARNSKESKENNLSSMDRRILSSCSQTQRIHLAHIEQGQYSAYAGGLIFVPLLQKYNFLSVIERVIGSNVCWDRDYTLDQFCLTLFYFDLFRFKSMEDFKTVYPEEFGILIGKLFGPGIRTLRRFLSRIKECVKSEELIDEFAKEYLDKEIVRWGVLYVDSHFLPYYGIYPITKGWHGVRKIPMKGSYNFLAVDERFTPFIFLVRPSSEDLLKKIPEIILKARELAYRAGIKKEGAEDIVVIFDREGYSAELFRMLDGNDGGDRKFKAKFISWAKYCDKWVDDIEDRKFNKDITVTYKLQKPVRIKYFETEKMMNRYGKVRTIAIENQKGKKRSAIYTNDRQIEAERVVQLICSRWGQENLIKELMTKHLIDYSPSYETEDIEEQPMVENPKVKELKQRMANLKSGLSQLKSKFGHEVLEEMAKDADWDEVKKKRILTIADIETIRSQITLLSQEADKLPKEIRFDSAHDGRRLVELNYEKKRFLDCIKIFAYNMEKKMCELLSNYYDKKKETWPALAMIVKRGAYVKLEDGVLTVKLRRFINSEIDYAARHLCEDLNKMKPYTLDKFRFPIRYEVA